MFEWFLYSTMIDFQAKLADSELMVQRYAYQEKERSILARSKVLAAVCLVIMFVVEMYTIKFPKCAGKILFTCSTTSVLRVTTDPLPDVLFFSFTEIVYFIIYIRFMYGLK